MLVNEDYVGRVYPPHPAYIVSAAKIKEFAEAVGSTDPVHTDREVARARGYRDVIAPPTFAVLISQRPEFEFLNDPANGIEFGKVLHGEEGFTHYRPLTAGDEVVATLRIESVRGSGSMTMIGVRTDLTVGDELVCIARSTVVVRGD
ncbi:MAG: FAS1-like dehydratase domain-containing protein [Dermatophilaceae bacterium]